jgi:hypothetical protein
VVCSGGSGYCGQHRGIGARCALLALSNFNPAFFQTLLTVLAGDEGPTANSDKAIVTYISFWMTAMLLNFVLSEGEHAATNMISAAVD